MSELPPVTRVTSGPELWLTRLGEAETPAGGVTVAQCLPAGYECYLRVFHPFTTWACKGRRTWRSLADEANLVFHAELSWQSLRPILSAGFDPARGLRFQVEEGNLEPETFESLHQCLLNVTGDKLALFYYGLASVVRGQAPVLISGVHSQFREVRELAEREMPGVVGPEYVWPHDRAWVVNTDFDLTSTYIACAANLAAAITQEPRLEVLPVQLTTRVDNQSDRVNLQLGD